jgi:hypothetical protein
LVSNLQSFYQLFYLVFADQFMVLFIAGLIQPRLSGPVPSEDQRAPRFAQLIGALFAFVALLGGVTGNSAVFLIATSFALGAAFLNAAFGFCLGCQIYLILSALN